MSSSAAEAPGRLLIVNADDYGLTTGVSRAIIDAHRAAAGRVDPDDLHRELGAQLQRLLDAGLAPDHLDTHQNLHLWPTVRRVVMELGALHGIRAIRVTRSTDRTPVGSTVRGLARRLEHACRHAGWAYTGASTGLDEAGHLDEPAMIQALFRLASTGAPTAELATHPGAPDDGDRHRYRWSYQWEDEYEALRSPVVRTAVDELGFRLGSFADLVPAGAA